MNINKQLGMRIRYLRKEKRLSQEQFSFKAGVAKNYISDLERGRRNPTVEVLEKIAIGLEISLSELFKGLESFEE